MSGENIHLKFGHQGPPLIGGLGRWGQFLNLENGRTRCTLQFSTVGKRCARLGLPQPNWRAAAMLHRVRLGNNRAFTSKKSKNPSRGVKVRNKPWFVLNPQPGKILEATVRCRPV
jgi:hypothetical protein